MPVMKPVYFFLAHIISCCFHYTGVAQLHPDQYHITFLTTQDGLSQATNFSMLQDSKGYMWIGSQDGINRYDGKRFFHFTDAVYYSGCEAPKQIFGIVEDQQGDIWMGSRDALYRYQQNENTFYRIHIPQKKGSGNSRIIPFAAAGDEIWFLKDDLLFMAINCRTKLTRQLYDLNQKLAIIDPYVMFPQTDGDGKIWMANANRLYEISPSQNSFEEYRLTANKAKPGESITIKNLSLHLQSGMLSIASDKGVLLFDTRQKVQKYLQGNHKLLTDVDTWHVKAGDDCFWVSNENAHLIKLSVDGNKAEQVFEPSVLDNELHRGSATACIYVDKWKRLWLNANGEYTAVIDLSKKFMRKIAVGKQGGLRSGTIQSITVADTVLWVSDSYLTRINKASGKVEKIFSSVDDLKMPGFFRQIYYDSLAHRIWFNTNYDLWYYSLKDNRFQKTAFSHNVNPAVDYIRNFVELPGHKLLLVRIDGVFDINRQLGTGRLLPAFSSSNINHLSKLSHGRLALSVAGQPLKIFEYTDDLLIQLKQEVKLGYSLLMTVEDSVRKILWAASEKGVYKLDNTTFSILQHYTVADGMANDFVYAVIPDQFGWIWCSTNRGIVAINSSSGQVRNFNKDPGLQALEYNNRAFATDGDGYVYFGGVKGVNYFKPPFADRDTIQPRLVVENILLNSKPYQSNINPDYITTVEYDYNPVPLTFKLQALHLVKTDVLKIMYRLKGQTAWSETDNGNDITMFNLSPGSYILELNYREDNVYSTAAVRQVNIVVQPPYYRTWWFLLSLSVVALLLVMYMVNRIQQRKLEKLQKENEIIRLKAEQQLLITKERERITTDLHDDIGASLSSMSLYGDLAGSLWKTQPEESKKLVDSISETSKSLMERMGDIVWSMKPADENRYTLEARLKNYSNELLAPKNIVCEFDLDASLAASIIKPAVRKNMLLIAKEAINNIAKYSEATRAGVILKREQGKMQLIISDNGKGFIQSEVPQGNGLQHIHQRCTQLNGYCDIVSAKDMGVVITCVFPVDIGGKESEVKL